MPAHRKKMSIWRKQMVATHSYAKREVLRKFKSPSQCKDYVGKITSLKHLARTTQYNVIMAITSYWIGKKKLIKQGEYYFKAEVFQ